MSGKMRWTAFYIVAGTFLRRVEKSKKNTKDKSGRALIFYGAAVHVLK